MTRKGKGKGGEQRATQAYPPKGHTVTASEKQALARLAKLEDKRARKKETRKIVKKVKKGLEGDFSSSSSDDDDSASSIDSDSSSSEPDKKKRKNRKKKTKVKKEQKGKQKASSSDGDESSSKGASKSKKKKLSKMSRLHQELQALKEEVAVHKKEKQELGDELREQFTKLESKLVDGTSVLHTPDKGPLTKEALLEAIADAGSIAAKRAEASRPPKGILAWFNEVSSTPSSAADPPEPAPSRQATKITAILREWLDIVACDTKKYVPLGAKNPSLNPRGNTLCANIAKKVSSWFQTPADLALLISLIKDFGMQTQASTPANIIKAVLVALLSREYDFNPEQLLVSRSDIMAMMKQG